MDPNRGLNGKIALVSIFNFEAHPRPFQSMGLWANLTECSSGYSLYLNWPYTTFIPWNIIHLLNEWDFKDDYFAFEKSTLKKKKDSDKIKL